MRYAAGAGGWFSAWHEDLTYQVKFTLADDGRLAPSAVLVKSAKPHTINESQLRSAPLNQIEAAANGPEYRDELVGRMDVEVTLGLEAAYDTDVDGYATARRRRPTGKLPMPDGTRYPDTFYRRAAVEYTRLIAAGEKAPASVIAAANDVPVTTAHRWIKEARRRGFLPAGRPGRAG
jgi:hypothetical protein